MKKIVSLLLALSLALSLTACGGGDEAAELHVFAAASLEESLNEVIDLYKEAVPEVTVVATYDSSGTLKTQIQEGADCDVFICLTPRAAGRTPRVWTWWTTPPGWTCWRTR